VLLQPGALSAAMLNFEDLGVGVVGGKILLANGDLQEAGSVIWADGTAVGHGRGDNPDRPQYQFRRPVDFCSGVFSFTPRRLFLELGGFNALYSLAYYEDADYCMKVWKDGRRVIYEPRAAVRHYESASSGGNEAAKGLIGQQKDLAESYNQARVFVVPPRYSAGIPYKAHEAAAFGVPLVVSSLIAEQMAWKDGVECLVADSAAAFAESCCRLYNDPQLWSELRSNALQRMARDFNEMMFANAISSLIGGTSPGRRTSESVKS
jgi:glycosyltransferase involved in cell wall biosynthesis